MGVVDRIKGAWNTFVYGERTEHLYSPDLGPVSTSPPDRVRRTLYNDRSIVTAIYNRMAIDVASIPLRHVNIDEKGRYLSDRPSALNACLTLEPNIDQGPRQFRQDIVLTLFDRGVSAIVPVETSANPITGEAFDIYQLRVGHVNMWYPRHVQLDLYNDRQGVRQNVTLPKRSVAIVENPLYSVMNEPNSTLQRLKRKLTLLDVIEEQAGSGKLDIIIQLPYTIRSEARKQQAEQRKADIEWQLKGSQYGIAYTDGTEKITQLNRPAENNLLKTVEMLMEMLYGELGITKEVMNGTADEATMLNYFNRTVEPILTSIIEAMQRTYISSKDQKIMFFRDPFKLVPVGQLAEIADKFTRNEIFSSNEMRTFMGIAPHEDPNADKLINSNMPQEKRTGATDGDGDSLERNDDAET